MRHYAARVAAASLLALAGAACAVASGGSAARPARAAVGRVVVFANSTTEPVKLYVAGPGAEWYVGYVQPGQTALLRLPDAAGSPVGRELWLLAVPPSARRSLATASAMLTRPNASPIGAPPAAIRSEPVSGDYLTSVKWNLVGRWLVPLPLPATP